MNGLTGSRILPPVVVVLALAGAAGLTSLRHSLTLAAGSSARPPAAAPVDSVIRACPSAGLAGSPASNVAMIAGSAAVGPGRAVLSRLDGTSATQLLSLTTPAVLSVRRVPAAPTRGAKASPAPGGPAVPATAARGGVVIRATGSMARGLEAEQVASAGGSTRCPGPGTDFWFAGPGRFTVAHIRLYLMNVASQPADVNVTAVTDAGPLQGHTDTGIAVVPHTLVTQSLDTLLHGSRVIALHVRTSVGQVVAGLEEITGKSGGGVWLPAGQAPASRLAVPGLPGTPGPRQLFVAVPGSRDARLTLTAVTAKGSYQPTGGAGLDIPGGSAVSIPLPSLGGVAGALLVSSTAPVTASVLVPGGQRGAPGVFTAAVPAIDQQGVVAVNGGTSGKVSDLVLSAPWHAVLARVSEIGARVTAGGSQAPAARTVRVAARHSVVVPLPRPAGSSRSAPFAVVITPLPGSGPLYAGRVVANRGTGGTLQSILPVASALTSVTLPRVRGGLITPRP